MPLMGSRLGPVIHWLPPSEVRATAIRLAVAAHHCPGVLPPRKNTVTDRYPRDGFPGWATSCHDSTLPATARWLKSLRRSSGCGWMAQANIRAVCPWSASQRARDMIGDMNRHSQLGGRGASGPATWSLLHKARVPAARGPRQGTDPASTTHRLPCPVTAATRSKSAS